MKAFDSVNCFDDENENDSWNEFESVNWKLLENTDERVNSVDCENDFVSVK